MSVTVKYKGNSIAELTENGTKTLQTSGKYCEADIIVENTKDGGATITDGIVVKARDAEGYATEVELYNSEGKVPNRQFSCSDYYGGGAPMKNVKTVVFKSPITEIGKEAFSYAQADSAGTAKHQAIENIDLSNVVKIGTYAFQRCIGLKSVDLSNCEQFWLDDDNYTYWNFPAYNFWKCTGLTSISLPKLPFIPIGAFMDCTSLVTVNAPIATVIKSMNNKGAFTNCTSLQNCEIGSITHGVTEIGDYVFYGCTQTGLTITVYTTGAYTDTALTNIRNGATNATIIIKAAEATTYNGTAYSAGETIITSEVTA